MKIRKLISAISVFVLVLVLLIYLSIQHSRKTILKIGTNFKSSPINPISNDSTISDLVIELIFDPLLRMENGQLQPALAERWEVSSDGLQWDFFLRPGVYFHDGHELTAEDVEFTYRSIIQSQRVGYANYTRYLKSVESINRYQFRLTLSQKDNNIFAAFYIFYIAPKHLLEHSSLNFSNQPIGTGPYRFVSQDSERIVLQKNEKYFLGSSKLDQIEFKFYSTHQSMLNHFIVGEVDFIMLLNPEDYGVMNKIPNVNVYKNFYPFLYALYLNHQNPFLRKLENRKLINSVISKKQILKALLSGEGVEAVNTHYVDYSQDLNKNFVVQPLASSVLLNAICLEDSELDLKILKIIKEDLLQVGIELKIDVLNNKDFFERLVQKRKFDLAIFNTTFRPYYSNEYSFYHSSQIEKGLNLSHYKNLKLDILLEVYRSEMHEEKRQAAYLEIQEILKNDLPSIFLFWRKMPIAVHKRFKGIPETQMESFYDLTKVYEE